MDSPRRNVCGVYDTRRGRQRKFLRDRGTLARIKHFGISVQLSPRRREQENRDIEAKITGYIRDSYVF